jgi:hypothetical protein
LQLNSPRGIETDSTFKDCQKVDIALDGEKITLPAMAKVDLKIHWNDLSLEEFSAQSKPLSDDLNDMSLRASGIVDSIIYDNREMSENNLAKILSLSSGKQGLLGLAITALVWIGKQIADRVGKMAMDRLFRGRRRRRKSRVSR